MTRYVDGEKVSKREALRAWGETVTALRHPERYPEEIQAQVAQIKAQGQRVKDALPGALAALVVLFAFAWALWKVVG